MKFSLRLNNDRPVGEYVQMAKLAEAAGFDQFWVSNDLFLRSAPVILSAVALATEQIEIGTCILNPYTMDPSEIAMFAATIDELSGQRFNLGLSSGASEFLRWVGIEWDKPRTSLVEVVQVINQLLSGEVAEYDGHFIHWTSEAYLRFEALRRVPIYVGALSPNMLRSMGSVADGGLPLLFPPEHYRNVMPYITEGVKSAGRDIADIDVAACVWCSVDDDAEAAKDALREKVAYYGASLSPMILKELGLQQDDFKEIERLAIAENDMAAAKKLVTDPMLQIGIVGTTHDLIERLEQLVAMGVQHISMGPPLGPNPVAAVEAIGRDVIPHFKDKA